MFGFSMGQHSTACPVKQSAARFCFQKFIKKADRKMGAANRSHPFFCPHLLSALASFLGVLGLRLLVSIRDVYPSVSVGRIHHDLESVVASVVSAKKIHMGSEGEVPLSDLPS